MIYTIEGSEDGLIGAVTSRGKAAVIAAEYLGIDAMRALRHMNNRFTVVGSTVTWLENEAGTFNVRVTLWED
jgi:NAD(P)H-nitrite reductase large subunit